ncbi:MAG: penicillin-binding transpeptidase domain-containing protein, partial [Pyrinomonadaceae bacterium]
MKLMSPKKLFASAPFALFIITLLFSAGVSAQSKKSKPAAKATSKKTVTSDKKDKKAKERDKASARDSKKNKNKDKLSAKDKAREKAKDKADAKADAKSKKDPGNKAELRRAEAERRQREAERRQAILAEQRRREQAAREARARRLAFERGLRTETVSNIQSDKTDGEDLAIRQAAINALGSHAGSVVVMEAQTGKVLTVVNQDWAIRSSIKPCSTIKLVTGVAGLHEGVVSKEDGSIRNRPTRRHLDDALAYSDNGYFQVVGTTVGNPKVIETARKFGLGEPTGINSEGETAGKLAIGNNNARIYSHGDDFEVSTVQLAVMVSAISNGGLRVIPRTPRNNIEKTNFQTFYRQRVDLPQSDVRRVIPGMMGAAAYGTARRGVDASLGIAGKTGSCISKGSWVGLFASVAPIEKPKYAVAVITRGEHERGKYAAGVAGQVYNALSRNIVRTDRNLAQTEFKLGMPTRNVVPVTDDEDENENENDNVAGGEITPPDTSVREREVFMVPSVVVPAQK